MKFFENFDFKVLCFLKMYPIFVGSFHNFGRSDDDMIQWTNAYFPQMYTWFDAHPDKKSWTVSIPLQV